MIHEPLSIHGMPMTSMPDETASTMHGEGASTVLPGCHDLPRGNLIVPASGAGGLVRVLPKVQYAVPLADSQSADIVLAKYIDTTLWVSAQLICREAT